MLPCNHNWTLAMHRGHALKLEEDPKTKAKLVRHISKEVE
jgi:hypothetical protein